MIDYIREMAELGFRSVELEGIGGEHLQAVANRSTEIRNALDDHGLSLAVFCTVLPVSGQCMQNNAPKRSNFSGWAAKRLSHSEHPPYWTTGRSYPTNFRPICPYHATMHPTCCNESVCPPRSIGHSIGMHLSKRCNEPATSPQNTDLPTICIPAAVR